MAKDLTNVQKTVFICNGNSCTRVGANDTARELRLQLKEHLLWDDVHTVITRCMGQCKNAPIVFIHPEGLWYKEVTPSVSRNIVNTYLLQNTLLKDHILYPTDGMIPLHPVAIKRLTFKRMINHLIFKLTGK